jgi:hypothetical protein
LQESQLLRPIREEEETEPYLDKNDEKGMSPMCVTIPPSTTEGKWNCEKLWPSPGFLQMGNEKTTFSFFGHQCGGV